MAKEMRIAGLSIPAGSSHRHTLEVTELADGSRITLIAAKLIFFHLGYG